MLKHEELHQKIESLPEEVIREVENFVDYLAKKRSELLKAEKKSKSIFGSAKGFFETGDDFNEPLEDFHDYMPE
jgi:hypothetical protein